MSDTGIPSGVTLIPPPILSDANSITNYAKKYLDGSYTSKPGHDTQDSYKAVSKAPNEQNAQAYVSELSQAAATANDGLSAAESEQVKAAATAALKGAGVSDQDIAQAVLAGFNNTPLKEKDDAPFGGF